MSTHHCSKSRCAIITKLCGLCVFTLIFVRWIGSTATAAAAAAADDAPLPFFSWPLATFFLSFAGVAMAALHFVK
jgi:TRAP-type C4-dicarboxylate transport system permease small subunit